MDFSAILIVLFKLFFLLVLGYVLFRCHVLDAKANKAISALIVNATSPALVLGSLAATGATSRGEVLKLVFFGIGAITSGGAYVFSMVNVKSPLL